ncbi:hypothetical protein [Arachnia propionica]|uniref:hypothetical protein n=1 Tax=Arachnia propionica TaxID=1750 RepID=UPI0028F0D766|nr:hypothetical protein [Arachnia propionica]
MIPDSRIAGPGSAAASPAGVPSLATPAATSIPARSRPGRRSRWRPASVTWRKIVSSPP